MCLVYRVIWGIFQYPAAHLKGKKNHLVALVSSSINLTMFSFIGEFSCVDHLIVYDPSSASIKMLDRFDTFSVIFSLTLIIL